MHHPGGHIVRPQAGVAVAQGGVDDADLFHGNLRKNGMVPSLTQVLEATQGKPSRSQEIVVS
jgi:hypothetical protein